MTSSAHPPSTSSSEVVISSLLADRPVPHVEQVANCRLVKLALRDGVDALLWRGNLARPLTMNVRDDWDRVHFSCALKGRCGFSIEGDTGGGDERVLHQGLGCISYTPGCMGRSSYADSFEYLTVSVRPDILVDWVPDLDTSLERMLDTAQCCATHRCGAEMRAAAGALSGVLRMMPAGGEGEDGMPVPSSAWLLGQALVLVGLAIEANRGEDAPSPAVSPADRRKLLRARDLLLADLTQAPTIAALARECGLSAVKLKRGFRQVFNQSVYGLFQRERMHEARRRFIEDHVPVTVVATDLGYANASHFAAAFQKQFGAPPSAFKRRR